MLSGLSKTARELAIKKNILKYSTQISKIKAKIDLAIDFKNMDFLYRELKSLKLKIAGAKKALKLAVFPKIKIEKIKVPYSNKSWPKPKLKIKNVQFIVGTSAVKNDRAWRAAKNCDYCAHVTGFHGSTAVLKIDSSIDPTTAEILTLCGFAATYSELPQLGITSAQVSYAKRSKVIKKSGYKKGQFKYLEFKKKYVSFNQLFVQIARRDKNYDVSIIPSAAFKSYEPNKDSLLIAMFVDKSADKSAICKKICTRVANTWPIFELENLLPDTQSTP